MNCNHVMKERVCVSPLYFGGVPVDRHVLRCKTEMQDSCWLSSESAHDEEQKSALGGGMTVSNVSPARE